MKKSQAFAAFRSSLIADYQAQVMSDLVPQFNAEMQDIRTNWEEEFRSNEAIADHRRRAREADLQIRRQDFLESINNDFRLAQTARINEYGGKIEEIEVERNGKKKKILNATFPDNSEAVVPNAVWIDFGVFYR